MKCLRCSKYFQRKASDIKRGRTKFCSRECSDSYKKESADRYAARVLRVGKKQCKYCDRTRKLDYFPKSKNSKTGYFSYCYECRRSINRNQDKKRFRKRLEYTRNRYLIRTYGISISDYEIMLREQGGGCAICGRQKDSHAKLAVDHDSMTGRVRGILCENCNLAIGQLAHDIERIRKAITYLERPVN